MPGDALYECCYIPEFPKVVRALRDWGGDIGAWWQDFADGDLRSPATRTTCSS